MTIELTVLGTASQSPTPSRNHGGYVLRWGHELVLVDPGEGSQRQLAIAHRQAARLTRVCITHFHGDHCLGLPGVLQAHALQGPTRRLSLHFEPSQAHYVDHLVAGSHLDFDLRVDREGIGPGESLDVGEFTISAHRLDHGEPPAVAWRLDGGLRSHLVPERLAEAGIVEEAIADLVEHGELRVGDRVVTIEEMSEVRPRPVVAFVMDTRPCDGALAAARGADLLVCESTYTSDDAELADRHHHMTAGQAAELAREAGVGLLVLSHYSARYTDEQVMARDAASIFPNVIAARDLQQITVPHPPRTGATQPPQSSSAT